MVSEDSPEPSTSRLTAAQIFADAVDVELVARTLEEAEREKPRLRERARRGEARPA